MNLKNFRTSLVWRISLGLFLILLVLGVSYVGITAYSARNYFNETTQKLHANVAEHMLLEVTPFKDGKVNDEAVGKIMHSMMAVNPSLEVYLLSTEGSILKYVVLDKKVRLENVDLTPIKEFIESGGETFILGDDPRNPGEKTIFSATAVKDGAQLLGYVYAVLDSEQHESIAGALASSYFLKLGAQGFALTLITAFLIGVILLFLLTKNLQRITSSVRKFEAGDYSERIPVKGNDELARVAKTFNHMADTIVANMEELKQVDRLRRELIANVSHDLRSPLAVMSGYIETLLLQEDQVTPEQRKRYLDIIYRSGERLNSMVSDLFELSKLEARQVEFQMEKFNVNELIQDTVHQFQDRAEKNDLTLKTDFKGHGIAVGDIAKIQRVVENLLDNALKYADAESEVVIRTEAQKDLLNISMENDGKVIAPEDIPHLFDRYYKIERHNTQSTGLGLAIVKKIIDGHNTSISARQPSPGHTVFSFQLPAA
jgi:signal transduction histidine kinase